MMRSKVRYLDIAIAADVSLTTAERVLNERGSVSAATREKVLQAARELSFGRVVPTAGHRNLVIETILQSNPTPYWSKLAEALQRSARMLPRGVTLHRTFVSGASEIRRAIERPSVRRSGLIVAAEIGEDIESGLRQVMQRGELVVSMSTMRTGLANQVYSGIDNVAAGRTAASLVNFGLRGMPGLVLVLQGNDRMQSHRDRVQGFLEALADAHAVEVRLTNETDGQSRRQLATIMAEGRMPLAIYETGDPGDEIAPLLRIVGPRPIWIGHEHNSVHDALMREGLLDFVLDQDPSAQVTWAISQILSALNVASPSFTRMPLPELRLYCSANLPEIH